MHYTYIQEQAEGYMWLKRWLSRRVLHDCANALEFKVERKHKNKKENKMLDGSEKSMMPILLDNKGSIVRHDRKVIARQEFSAGTGIADVVMFSIDDEILAERLNRHKTALTDYRILSTYLAIERGSAKSPAELSKMLNFSIKAINDNILPSLINAGLVEMENGMLYSIDTIIERSPVLKCVAIEAKVKDWKGGIRQACRYKEFADETYLAIYKKHSTVALKNIELFKALDVGLLIVDNGNVEMIHQPNVGSFKAINRLLASERLISTLDNFNQPYVSREPFARSL